jgi:hypothetical protein
VRSAEWEGEAHRGGATLQWLAAVRQRPRGFARDAWKPKALGAPPAGLCDLRDRPGFSAALTAKRAASAVNALD